MSLKEIQENIDNTYNAFSSWSRTSTNYRSEILKKWGELITKNINDLSYILTLEQGKTLKDAKILYAISFINWFADLIYHVQGSIKPGHSINHKITMEYEPLGVVAAIIPWNFPYAMIARKVSPAIVAGCTVVLKPSEITPLSAYAMGILATEAGLPRDVFNIITGDEKEIGKILCDDFRIRKLSFTGSTKVGQTLYSQCAKH